MGEIGRDFEMLTGWFPPSCLVFLGLWRIIIICGRSLFSIEKPHGRGGDGGSVETNGNSARLVTLALFVTV